MAATRITAAAHLNDSTEVEVHQMEQHVWLTLGDDALGLTLHVPDLTTADRLVKAAQEARAIHLARVTQAPE